MRHEYAYGTGPARERCWCVGHRLQGDEGYDPDTTESVVLALRGTENHGLLVVEGLVTGLARRADGFMAAPTLDGRIYSNPSGSAKFEDWVCRDTGAALSGAWAIGSRVFVCGMRGGRPLMLTWNGADWAEVPTDGFPVAVGGVGDDDGLLYCVGRDGYIGRWDRGGFRAVSNPASRALSSVHVIGDDLIYACGPGGEILEGTVYGWSLRAEVDHMVHSIRRFRDRVWVASGVFGLHALDADELVPVKPNVFARTLDTTEDRLLITAPQMVVDTVDGAQFQATFVDGFAAYTALN